MRGVAGNSSVTCPLSVGLEGTTSLKGQLQRQRRISRNQDSVRWSTMAKILLACILAVFLSAVFANTTRTSAPSHKDDVWNTCIKLYPPGEFLFDPETWESYGDSLPPPEDFHADTLATRIRTNGSSPLGVVDQYPEKGYPCHVCMANSALDCEKEFVDYNADGIFTQCFRDDPHLHYDCALRWLGVCIHSNVPETTLYPGKTQPEPTYVWVLTYRWGSRKGLEGVDTLEYAWQHVSEKADPRAKANAHFPRAIVPYFDQEKPDALGYSRLNGIVSLTAASNHRVDVVVTAHQLGTRWFANDMHRIEFEGGSSLPRSKDIVYTLNLPPTGRVQNFIVVVSIRRVTWSGVEDFAMFSSNAVAAKTCYPPDVESYAQHFTPDCFPQPYDIVNRTNLAAKWAPTTRGVPFIGKSFHLTKIPDVKATYTKSYDATNQDRVLIGIGLTPLLLVVFGLFVELIVHKSTQTTYMRVDTGFGVLVG